MSREAMKLALEALEYIYEGANNQGPHTGISWRCVSKKSAPVITALRQALANEALDKKAENARELGLDYEPVWDNLPSNKDVEDAMRLKRLSRLAEQPAQQQEPVVRCMEHGECFGGECIYTSPPAQQEPVAWRNAALRVGEDLCSVGPFGYYDMTAEQWLDWALSVVTVHAPPAQQPPQFMVSVDGTGAPRVVHVDIHTATAEAERLAKLPDNRARTIRVLQVVATLKPLSNHVWDRPVKEKNT